MDKIITKIEMFNSTERIVFWWMLIAICGVLYAFIPEIIFGLRTGTLHARKKGEFHNVKERPMFFIFMLLMLMFMAASPFLGMFSIFYAE